MPHRVGRDALAQGTSPAANYPFSSSSNDRQDAVDVGFRQSLVVSGDRLSWALAIRQILATLTDAEDTTVSANYSLARPTSLQPEFCRSHVRRR